MPPLFASASHSFHSWGALVYQMNFNANCICRELVEVDDIKPALVFVPPVPVKTCRAELRVERLRNPVDWIVLEQRKIHVPETRPNHRVAAAVAKEVRASARDRGRRLRVDAKKLTLRGNCGSRQGSVKQAALM